MNDATDRKELALAVWVVLSAITGYACLAYAVMYSDGERLRSLVNRIFGDGV